MRHLFAVLAASCLLATVSTAEARPLDVHVHVRRLHVYPGQARIRNYLVFHGLLTPEQAACSTLIRGPLGSRRVAHLGVFETSGTRRCPGPPQPPVHLFDVFVDTFSGAVDTTKDDPNELKTVL